ncbi:MAG TPA: hypothetical protein V6D17_03795 [Candidatus Obscuribacterales bacterium]
MSMIMSRNAVKTRLGELAVGGGLVERETLSSSLLVARKATIPLGRVLLMSGAINDRELSSALAVQQLVREGSLAVEAGHKVLQEVRLRKIDINQALTLTGVQKNTYVGPHDIGEFVIAAGIATRDSVQAAARLCVEYDCLIGRALVAQTVLSPSLLFTCLELRMMVDGGSIDTEKALRLLEFVHFRKIALKRACQTLGHQSKNEGERPRLLELIMAAGLISESDAAFALEIALTRGEKVGQVILDAGLVTERVLTTALQLQHLVAERAIWREHASQLLSHSQSLDVPLKDIVFECQRISRVIDLLIEAAVPPDVDYTLSLSPSGQQPGFVDRVLMLAKRIDESVMLDAQAYLQMVESGESSFDEAARLLRAHYLESRATKNVA